jgi:pimeloyl-ACP methyl ester carboxylesterase
MATRLGASVAVVDGAGHSPAAQRPAETAAALIDFWASA